MTASSLNFAGAAAGLPPHQEAEQPGPLSAVPHSSPLAGWRMQDFSPPSACGNAVAGKQSAVVLGIAKPQPFYLFPRMMCGWRRWRSISGGVPMRASQWEGCWRHSQGYFIE